MFTFKVYVKNYGETAKDEDKITFRSAKGPAYPGDPLKGIGEGGSPASFELPDETYASGYLALNTTVSNPVDDPVDFSEFEQWTWDVDGEELRKTTLTDKFPGGVVGMALAGAAGLVAIVGTVVVVTRWKK